MKLKRKLLRAHKFPARLKLVNLTSKNDIDEFVKEKKMMKMYKK